MIRRERRVLTDTTPLYALLDDRDQAHARAVAAFTRLEKEAFAVTCLLPALLELHRLLVVRKPSRTREAQRLLEDVFDTFGVEMPVREDIEEARQTLRRYSDQKITLADVTIAAMAVRLGVHVLTFDKRHFALMGARVYGEGSA